MSLRTLPPAPRTTSRLTGALTLGALLPLIDTTIVGVALQPISKALHAPASQVSWIATVYLLTAAWLIPVTPWMLQHWGGRTTWLRGLWLFLLGSIGCSIAWSTGSLVLFRAVQGAGAGILMPMLLTLLVETVGSAKARPLLGKIGSLTAWAPCVGPLLGAGLLDVGSWRTIFLVNIPLTIAAIGWARRALPRQVGVPTAEASWDGLGSLWMIVALGGLVVGLAPQSLGEPLWSAERALELAVGVVALALYGRHAHRHPTCALVDLRLFRVAEFRRSSVLLLLTGFVFYGSITLLPLWLERVKHVTVIGSGLWMVLMGLGIVASRGLIKRFTWSDRTMIRFGWTAMLVGTLPFCGEQLIRCPVVLPAALLVRGMGLGALSITTLGRAFVGLEPAQVKHASSVVRLMLIFGGSLGVAVLSQVLAVTHLALAGVFTTCATIVIVSGIALLPTFGMRSMSQ